MKYLLISIISLAIFTGVSGCKKSPFNINSGADVYVTGSIKGNAGYWKNGTAVTLVDSASADGIVNNGNDIYIAGSTSSSNGYILKAVYWKNGVMTVLGKGSAVGIAVQGNNIYVTGVTYDNSNNSEAALWKNGVLSILPGGLQAYRVIIDGSDIYVAGFGSGAGINAMYWKNGQEVNLGPGLAFGITVQNSDVYVSGYSNTSDSTAFGGYWKNGIFSSVAKNATMGDIKVSGTDVYITGYTSPTGTNGYESFLWKNGVPTLINNLTYARGISLSGNDVYVAGYINDFPVASRACVWKNGALTTLSIGNTYDYANSVLVVNH